MTEFDAQHPTSTASTTPRAPTYFVEFVEFEPSSRQSPQLATARERWPPGRASSGPPPSFFSIPPYSRGARPCGQAGLPPQAPGLRPRSVRRLAPRSARRSSSVLASAGAGVRACQFVAPLGCLVSVPVCSRCGSRPPVVWSLVAGPGPAGGGRAAGRFALLLVCRRPAGGCGRSVVRRLPGFVPPADPFFTT